MRLIRILFGLPWVGQDREGDGEMFRKRGTMLSQGDIQLSQIFDPHYHAGDVYVAKGHHVLRRVCIPGGPQGYVTIQIPADIRTREQLVRYLVAEHGFRIKDP